MRILILTHFFPPETGAAPLRIKYFTEALYDSEHEIKIISPRPNYPGGKKYAGFENRFKIYNLGNITYLPIFFTSSDSLIGRMLSYLNYFLFSLIYVIFSPFKPSVIISSSPPLFTALSAALLSKIKRSRFILDIRDIWPDIGIELGILNRSLNIKLLRKIEKYIMDQSVFITVTAMGDKQNLIDKNVPQDKIHILYNGADFEAIKPLQTEEKNNIRKKYALPADKKLLVYFGSFNYGMNDIETLMGALEQLTDYKEEFHFIAIGNGSNKRKFVDTLKDKINLTSFDNFSAEELSNFIPCCDISIIPRKLIKNDTGGNLPVKCFESWAAGLPVVMSNINNPEIIRIFEESKGGILVEPQNREVLNKELITFMRDDNSAIMGLEARRYSLHRFSRQKNATKLADLVNSLA